MTDPQKDDHIEELLGKLQGIFGKLSHSEEEDTKQTIEVSSPAPKEPEPKAVSKPASEPEAPSIPTSAAPTPLTLYSEIPASSDPKAEIPKPAAAPVDSGNYVSSVTMEDPEKMTVPTAVYYPAGREAEAQSLARKLQNMTPKFDKNA